MMTTLLFAGLLAASPDAPAGGGATAMARLEPAFKGTIVTVYPDGRRGRLYLNADNTYRYVGRTAVKSGGVWSVDRGGEKVCLRQRAPLPLPIRYCTEIPSGKTWTAKAQTGEVLRVHVEPGREG